MVRVDIFVDIKFEVIQKLRLFIHHNLFLQYDKERLRNLEHDMKMQKEKEAQIREMLAECQKEAEKQKKKYEEQILSLQKERIQLSDEIEQVILYTYIQDRTSTSKQKCIPTISTIMFQYWQIKF